MHFIAQTMTNEFHNFYGIQSGKERMDMQGPKPRTHEEGFKRPNIEDTLANIIWNITQENVWSMTGLNCANISIIKGIQTLQQLNHTDLKLALGV